MTSPVIIIGTGLAGYNLAREIRKRDKELPLCLVSRDDGTFYSKPMLSNGLAKNKTPQALSMGDAEKMTGDLSAEIITHKQVVNIDASNKRIELDDGSQREYSKLVLAVGAKPIVLPMQGNASDQVLTINDLQDYAVFRQQLEQAKTVAIIGPGLIGCEFANDLLSQDYQVHVIGPDITPLSTLLPEAAGRHLQQALSEQDVRWHLQTVVQSINTDDDGFVLSLKNGETVRADLVLSAIGLRAEISLAEQAGLKTSRGIVVDRYLQTSDKNIYAIGDCAEVEGMVLPFVLPLMACSRSLGATLCGETTTVSYPAMPVVVKTPACPVVVSPPAYGAEGEWQIEASDNGVKALFNNGDDLLGFALTGETIDEKQALTKLLPAVLP